MCAEWHAPFGASWNISKPAQNVPRKSSKEQRNQWYWPVFTGWPCISIQRSGQWWIYQPMLLLFHHLHFHALLRSIQTPNLRWFWSFATQPKHLEHLESTWITTSSHCEMHVVGKWLLFSFRELYILFSKSARNSLNDSTIVDDARGKTSERHTLITLTYNT